MNHEDQFEERLRRQPSREVPAHWRTGILQAARATGSPPSPLDPRLAPWWRGLFWPCPQAWAGLATVWLVILAVNFAARDPLPVREARKEAPASRNLFLALKEQEQLLAELTGTPPPQLAVKPKPTIPQPRSQRREDCRAA